MADLEQASRSPEQPVQAHTKSGDGEKLPGMRPLADQASVSSDADSTDSAQAGVKRLEAVAATWSKKGLIGAYVGLYLMAYVTSLEQQVTLNFTAFATSAFSAHSLVATVAVVQGVVLSVIKPPMSKIADVFGRLEAFSLCIFLYVIGYIMQAGSNNVRTYASATIFYASGQTGLQILQQIFVADTSDLLNRALMSTIPDIPFLINVWVGSPIAQNFINGYGWRWGYGIWTIILPAAFVPLALSLFINQRRASQRGLLPPAPYAGMKPLAVIKNLWYELDFFGLLLLSAFISLILIPLTLAASAKGGWNNGSIIAMLVIGACCLVAFPFWERSPKLAPRAFFPRNLFRHRTVLAGVGIAFFYFMAFYLSVFPYFYSYLLVVQGSSITAAGHITQTFTFSSTVASICVSFAIKYTKHYKYFVTFGACLYMVGIGLMLRYRQEGASTSTLVGCQIAVGIGGGMLNVPAQLGVQASATHQEVAAATAIFLTILEIGGAVGSAISGAIWTQNLLPKLQLYLPPETRSQATEIFGNVTLASTGWPMGDPTRVAINRAYQETMTKILTVAVCVCIPLIPLSLCMKNYKLDTIDQHVKGIVVGNNQDVADRRERDPLAPNESQSSSDGEGEPSSSADQSGSVFDKVRRKLA